MDWLDYRQALGLSFNDNQKKSLSYYESLEK